MLTPSFEEEICISLFPSINDALEVSSLQGSATDQATVNVRLCKQFLGIAWLAATAVQDAYVLSCFVAELFSNDVADELVHFFSLFSSGSLTGTNGPYWFVSQDDVREFFLRKVEE